MAGKLSLTNLRIIAIVVKKPESIDLVIYESGGNAIGAGLISF
jgi:hypothetical protein